jgi:hypothetical protein
MTLQARAEVKIATVTETEKALKPDHRNHKYNLNSNHCISNRSLDGS